MAAWISARHRARPLGRLVAAAQAAPLASDSVEGAAARPAAPAILAAVNSAAALRPPAISCRRSRQARLMRFAHVRNRVLKSSSVRSRFVAAGQRLAIGWSGLGLASDRGSAANPAVQRAQVHDNAEGGTRCSRTQVCRTSSSAWSKCQRVTGQRTIGNAWRSISRSATCAWSTDHNASRAVP